MSSSSAKTKPGRSTTRTSRTRRFELLAICVFAASGVGCASACGELTAQHEALAASSNKELAEIPKDAPSVVGMTLSAAAVEKLVNDAVFARNLETHKRSISVAGSRLSMQARMRDLTLLPLEDCADCVRVSSRVRLRAEAKTAGISIGRTDANATVTAKLPLNLEDDGKKTSLVADLERTEIEKVDLNLSGLPTWATRPINDMARRAVNATLSTVGTEITVLSWEPLELADTGIALTPRDLKMVPADNTMWVGWASNLPRSEISQGLREPTKLQRGELLAASFDRTILTSAAQAMLDSGLVDSRYDSDFKPDKDGAYRVVIESITPRDGALETAMSLWHLPQSGSCYVVDARGLVSAKPSEDDPQRLAMKLDDIEVVDTRGDTVLLDIQLWAASVFWPSLFNAETSFLSARKIKLGPLGRAEITVKRVDIGNEALTIVSDVEFPQDGSGPR